MSSYLFFYRRGFIAAIFGALPVIKPHDISTALVWWFIFVHCGILDVAFAILQQSSPLPDGDKS